MGLTSEFEWWQLWSCHLAHWDARHFLLNLSAALPPVLLLPRPLLGWAAAGLFAAAPLLSLVILSFGLNGEYRGASGLVVALWFFAAITLLQQGERRAGLILLAVIIAKLVLEALGWWPSTNSSFVLFPVAHYAGAVIGVAGGLAGSVVRGLK